MAQKEVVIYYDDMTGDEIDPNGEVHIVPIVLDGMVYELTLSDESKAAFDTFMAPLTERADSWRAPKDLRDRSLNADKASRRATRDKVTEKRGAPTTQDRERNKRIREWWEANWKNAKLPRPKSARGKIPEAISDAYMHHDGQPVANHAADTEQIREAAKSVALSTEGSANGVPVKGKGKAAKKATAKGSEKPAQASNGAHGANGQGGGKPADMADFVEVYKQTGGDTAAIMDAFPDLTKQAVYSRVSDAKKKGLIAAK